MGVATIGAIEAPRSQKRATEVDSWRLSVREEQALIRRWQKWGDRAALARLVESQRWLVRRIARQLRQNGESLDDLMQQGLLGVVIAINRFDPGRRLRLCTYAVHWIRAEIFDSVMRSRSIVRMPRATSPIGRDMSLDAPGGRTRELPLSERLADDRLGPEELLIAADEEDHRRGRLHQALQRLDPRERTIIEGRWLAEPTQNLRTVGRRLGISRERVRQLELRARQKLRDGIVGSVDEVSSRCRQGGGS